MGGFLIFLMVAFYMLPTVVALGTGHKNPGPLIIINIFLGWSILGWVVALAMSFSNK